ncbi:MAG: ArsA family ATPase [Acidimicrobiales bacterium]
MDLGAFCTQTRVVIVAGKGGVGKTTVTAALARLASRTGRRVLIVETDSKSGLAGLFASEDRLGYAPVELARATNGAGDVSARVLTPDDALIEYLEDHGMRRILKRLTSTGALDVVATAVPGIKDILVLGKVKQLERDGDNGADLIVVDAPAAGHAVTFLASARGLLDTASVGPIRTQAGEVIELLSDPKRAQVLLVTLPEETPVNELVDTAFALEDRVGITLLPVVVNGLFPPLDLPEDPAAALGRFALEAGAVASATAAALFRRRRQDLQDQQVQRLAEGLALPQLRLPYLFTAELGPTELDVLAGALDEAIQELAPAAQP